MTAPATPEITVGSILGETYEIFRLLGEGGMGAVWEAKHLRLPGKRFAVKVLHGHASADREAYARFRREAEIASRIGHPSIIEVLDWNTLPSGTPYLVLEFLDGEDLAARLSRGPVPVDQALTIARQIGSALNAAHAAEVVHRDLKPGNIFLVPREVGGEMSELVKVLDFGISKIRNSQTVQTQDAVLLGTPQYMAPEQALGKNNEIDGRTDVFALAAIVYEMLSGKAAFSGSSLAEVVFKVVYEPVPPLKSVVPDVSADIAAAVERGMAKSAGDRFPDVSSFIAALTGRALLTTDRRAVRGSDAMAVPPTQAGPKTGPGASQLRGELQVRPEASRGGKGLVFLIAAVVIGAGGTLAAVRLLRPPAQPSVSLPVDKPVAAKTAEPSVGPKPPEPQVEPPKPVEPTVTPPKPVEPTVATKSDDPGATKKTPARTHVEPAVAEPPEVKAMLDEGEAALQRGERDAARVLADRSLRIKKTSRAFAILTRAHCGGGDLGNARATYQHVAAGDRPRVRKDCKAHDIDLD